MTHREINQMMSTIKFTLVKSCTTFICSLIEISFITEVEFYYRSARANESHKKQEGRSWAELWLVLCSASIEKASVCWKSTSGALLSRGSSNVLRELSRSVSRATECPCSSCQPPAGGSKFCMVWRWWSDLSSSQNCGRSANSTLLFPCVCLCVNGLSLPLTCYLHG